MPDEDGMPVTINNVVVHRLVKEQHQPIRASQMRDAVLDRTNENVQKLIHSLVAVYGTRYNTAQYGVFDDGAGRGTFPDAFERYAGQAMTNEAEFLALSRMVMGRLYQQARQLSAASGGYMVFADYERDSGRQFLVAMVKAQPGLTLTETLQPEELMALDLDRVHQGARINFRRFADYQAAGPKDRQEIRYLSFVSPRSAQETAGYFVTALGCTAGTTASRSTDNLLRESKKLFRETPQLRSNRENFEQRLLDYLHDKRDERASVRVSEVAHLVQQHIPTEMAEAADEIVEHFVTRLNSEEVQVPPEFPVNAAVLKRHTHITGQSSSWKLSLERGALSTDPAAQNR
ncbi:hypothetical protein BA897_03315 [Spiribacter roseus]|nr:hypothetical protein BA897_03315 [Spiribacter roseus]